MRRSQWLILFLLFVLTGVLFGQEEELSETPQEQEKKLEWSGNLDVKYTLFQMDQNSSQYKLQFFKERSSPTLISQYKIEPYLNAEYRTSDLGFVLKTHATYYSDANAQFDLFESYGSFNPSLNVTLQSGKRMYSWGKGYAFNPVGFVNSIKDPENPELAQAGLLSANIEYLKSFQSDVLQSFAMMFVVIPSSELLNSRYGDVEKTDVALKTYFLLWDTDIDLMTYYSDDKPKRYGVDFARNLKENFEIHGEVSLNLNSQRYSILNDSIYVKSVDNYSYLFGLRYLSETNVTVIAEYYHNGLGLTRSEYEQYGDYLQKSTANNNPFIMQQALGVSQTYFRSSTVMEDYLYLKIIYPEPFDMLYFTPSLYTIYNLADKSFLLSLQMNYKPATNVEFIFWPSALIGGDQTEYGDKQVKERLELWMRVYF
ncbi:MAG: hypothetical protein Q8L88_08170 [Bacteroidota bacterium]|nr:hypothetical protein [Bacteroidota bacterium]